MKNSPIEWTHHTFNPWIGCTKVDELCAHCYAEARDRRFTGGAHWGKGAPRQRTSHSYWGHPIAWDMLARAKRTRYRVFSASLADWLDDEVPIDWLADLLALIQATPNLDWQLLTKRPENWYDRVNQAFQLGWNGDEWASTWLDGEAPANVWIGTSVGTQKSADTRIPQLLEIPARVRFLSCEPLLEQINLGEHVCKAPHCAHASVDWVICGGESGSKARPMHPNWARSLRDQCAAGGVPFLFKQWGEWCPPMQAPLGKGIGDKIERGVVCYDFPDNAVVARFGKHATGRRLDGIEHNAFPSVPSVGCAP
jgi:protein gp37